MSIIRLIFLIQVKTQPYDDFTYSGTTLNYWNSIEVHTGILVSCLMTLKPLAARWFPSLLSERSETADSTTGGAGSNPPLTIGSRTLRNVQPRLDSWAYDASGPGRYDGDVMLDDVEAKGGFSPQIRGGNKTSWTDGSKSIRVSKGAELDLKPPNTARSQASELMVDLGPTARTRSLS